MNVAPQNRTICALCLYVTLTERAGGRWVMDCTHNPPGHRDYMFLCLVLWTGLALLVSLALALLLVQVWLITDGGIVFMQSVLNKTWSEIFNQERASAAVSGWWYQHSSYSPRVLTLMTSLKGGRGQPLFIIKVFLFMTCLLISLE